MNMTRTAPLANSKPLQGEKFLFVHIVHNLLSLF